MSINLTNTSIKTSLADAKALFSDKIQDEHSIFTGLGEDRKALGEYVDPMKDEGYAKFAAEMKEMINSVTDPEIQAVFAEQFEATSKAVSDRLNYQASQK